MAKKRKTKRTGGKKRRSAAQKAATRKMLAANRSKRAGKKTRRVKRRRKAAAPKVHRKRRRVSRKRRAPKAVAATRRTRRVRRRKGGKIRKGHRPWNKGKRLKHKKAIGGYRRKATVARHVRRVNPRHRRRHRNPAFGVGSLVVGGLGAGATFVAASYAEPHVPLTGYGLAGAEVVAGGVLGWLASKIHPAFGIGVGAGLIGRGIQRGAQEIMGPPAASAPPGGAATQTLLTAGAAQQLINTRSSMAGIYADGNRDIGRVEEHVGRVDLQMGAIVQGDDDALDAYDYDEDEVA